MGRLGYGIIPQLFNSGLGYSGQAGSLNEAWTSNALQNSAQQAALAEARRRALEQEKLQRQAIKAQEEAQDKAQTNQWLQMGIGTAAGVGGGAALGGLAAAPAAGAVAAPIEGAGIASAATPAMEAAPLMSPTGIATTQAAAAGPMSQGVPFTGSVGMTDPRLATAGRSMNAAIPQVAPFAGGSVGRGAALGGLLGGAGVLSGQNLLGPALQMPYQQFGAQMAGANAAADWANQANNQALGWARYGEDVAHHRETSDIQREGNRLRDPAYTSTFPQRAPWFAPMLPEEQLPQAAAIAAKVAPDANTTTREAGTQNRFMTIPPVVAYREGKIDERFDRPSGSTIYGQGAADLRQMNSQEFRSGQNQQGREAAMERAKFVQSEITKRANQGGTAGKTPSVGYADTAQRIMDASSVQDASNIVDRALSNKAITPGEAADLKRRLGM